MMRTKLIALSLMFVLVFTTFAGCGGGTDKKDSSAAAYSKDNPITFRLASDAPLEHIATGLNNDLCKMVAEKTDGRVKVEYFGASQLGSYETVYNELVMGSIDCAQITVPDSLDARLGAAYLPYFALSFDEASVLYAPDSFLSKQFGELTEKTGVTFLGFVLEGFIGMGCVKEPTDVFTPGTNKNMKMRSPAMATFRYVQEDLGYNPITITYAEVPTAIQTKIVDGWIGGTPNINYAWVGEIINYMYINYIHAEATSYVISDKSLAKLTPEDQEIVKDCFKAQSAASFKASQKNEEVYKQKLRDAGVKVIEFTPEQLATNAKFVREKTWTRLEPVLTKELIDGCRQAVADYETKK
jgi:TRAP-type transport system periplasmic protein